MDSSSLSTWTIFNFWRVSNCGWTLMNVPNHVKTHNNNMCRTAVKQAKHTYILILVPYKYRVEMMKYCENWKTFLILLSHKNFLAYIKWQQNLLKNTQTIIIRCTRPQMQQIAFENNFKHLNFNKKSTFDWKWNSKTWRCF